MPTQEPQTSRRSAGPGRCAGFGSRMVVRARSMKETLSSASGRSSVNHATASTATAMPNDVSMRRRHGLRSTSATSARPNTGAR